MAYEGSTFTTNKQCKIKFRLPELFNDRIIEYKVHVDEHTQPHESYYNMLLGGDICSELGIIIDYQNNVVQWDGATVPMVDRDVFCQSDNIYQDLYEATFEGEAARSATSRMTRILDNDYHKSDQPKIVQQCTHLSMDERAKLLALLRKHEPMFDGTLGKWNVPPLDLQLKPNCTQTIQGLSPYQRYMRKHLRKKYAD